MMMKKIVNNKNKPTLKKAKKSTKTSNSFIQKSSYSTNQVAIGPFLAATFIAIFIGLFLGFMMLNMFAKKDNITNDRDPQTLAASKDEDVNEQSENKNITTLKQVKAFVIQLGVFSEQKNADTWAKTYEQAGVPSTIFQRDNQYFLFTGVANSEEKAKEFAADLSKQEIEVYVKEWITNQKEIELTDEESKWIQSFQKQWQATLSSLSKQEGILLNDWKVLIENDPQNSEKITLLVEEIQPIFDDEVETEDVYSLHNKLLNIWKNYEEIFIFK